MKMNFNKINTAKWLEKYKSILGRMDRQKWIVCILFGVLLLVIAIPVEPKTGASSKKKVETSEADEALDEYESQMEKRLEHLLEQMDGVGKVDVMIYSGASDDEEHYITQQKTPEVRGICVVAEGAGDSETRVKIYNAIQALFSIDAHKISIVEMGVQEGT